MTTREHDLKRDRARYAIRRDSINQNRRAGYALIKDRRNENRRADYAAGRERVDELQWIHFAASTALEKVNPEWTGADALIKDLEFVRDTAGLSLYGSTDPDGYLIPVIPS